MAAKYNIILLGMFFGGVLLLINCNAFVLETTTETFNALTIDSTTKNHVDNSASHVAKIGRSLELRMPFMEEIITFVETNRAADEPRGEHDDDHNDAQDQPSRVITYKELCKMLGKWHLNNEMNHYDMRGEPRTERS